MSFFGDQTAGSGTATAVSDRAWASKFTLTQSGHISKLWARFDATSTAGTNAKAVVYTDVSGVCTSRLAVGPATAIPAGGGNIALPIAIDLPPGTYWLGFATDNSQAVPQIDTTGAGLSRMDGSADYTSPRNPWVETGTLTGQLNIYAEYTVSFPSLSFLPAESGDNDTGTRNFTITVPAGCKTLVALGGNPRMSGSATWSGVAWDTAGVNQAFTKQGATQDNIADGWGSAEIWILQNPTPGVSKTLTVSQSGPATPDQIGVTIVGYDEAVTIVANSGANFTSAAAGVLDCTISSIATQPGDVIVTAIGDDTGINGTNGQNDPPTVVGGATYAAQAEGGGDSYLAAGYFVATGTSTNLTWRYSANHLGGSGGIAVKYVVLRKTAALLQSADNLNVAAGTELGATFSNNVSVGNTIYVVGTHHPTGAAATVSDNLGNTYVPIGNADDGGNQQRLVHFYAKVVVGGACTVTLKTPSDPARAIRAQEWNGIDSVVPLDAHNENVQTSVAAGTDNVVSNTATNTSVGVMVGVHMDDSAATSAPSAGTGFVDDGTGWNFFGTNCARFQHKAVVPGTQQSVASAVSTRSYISVMAMFRVFPAIPSVRGTPTTVDIAASATSFVINKPTGAIEGDVLIVDIAINNQSDSTNNWADWTHADFTLVGHQADPAPGDAWWDRVSRYKRKLTASEPSSWTFSKGAGPVIDPSQASCICIRDADNVGASASGGNGGAGGSSTWTSGSLTTTKDNSLVLRVWSTDSTDSLASGAGGLISGYTAGLTEHLDAGNNASNWTYIALTSEIQATAGATGSKTATNSFSTGNIWIATEITPAVARTPIASDNFNRSTGIGANWLQLNASNAGNARIVLDTVLDGFAGAGGNDGSSIAWAGAGSFTDDQYSSIVVTDLSFGSVNYGIGVICRASTDTDAARDLYYFNVRTDGTGFLGKVVNGTDTVLNTGAVSFAAGDRIELECQGTTIRAMKNGVALGGAWTVTDSSLSTGKPGACPVNGGAGCNGDNWVGGNLPSVAAAVTHALAQSGAIAVAGTVTPSGTLKFDKALVQSGAVAVTGSLSPTGTLFLASPWTTVKGFNFRSTLGFVTDPANTKAVLGSTFGAYPQTVTIGGQSVVCGWETPPAVGNDRDRDSGVDARLAGVNFDAPGTAGDDASVFRVDLPAPGDYKIRLALGDQGSANAAYAQVRDSTTNKVSVGPTSFVAGEFVDAAGVKRISASDWVGNNTQVTQTFSSTVFRFVNRRSGGATTFAHLEIEQAASGPAITSTSSASPANGSSLTINGTGFGATQGASTVTIGGVSQTVTSWSDTVIVVTVGRGTNKYGVALNVIVTVGTPSNSYSLTGGLTPQSGWSFVNVGTPFSPTSGRLTSSPDLASGDQIAWSTAGGLVTVFADGTWSANPSVASFDFEVWTTGFGYGSTATQTISGAFALAQSGAVAISGTPTLTGTLSLFSLAQVGAVAISGAPTVSGLPKWNVALTQSGAVAVAGTLTHSGTFLYDKALAQSGAIAVNGTITHAAQFSYSTPLLALAQSGAIGISGSLAHSGNFSYDKALSQTGAIGLNGTVTITGNLVMPFLALAQVGSITINGTPAITGLPKWNIALTQSGAVAINGSPTVSGTFSLFTLAQVGAIAVAGTATVSGNIGAAINLTQSGAVGVSGVLSHAAALVYVRQLIQSGATALSGTVSLSGNFSYFQPALTLAQVGAVGINGTVTVSGNVGWNIPLTQTGQIATNGTLTVSGLPQWNIGLVQSGAISVTGSLAHSGNLSYAAPTPIVQVGVTPIAGTVSVSGDLSYTLPSLTLAQVGAVALTGTVTVSGDLPHVLDKPLAQSGAIAVAGTVSVSGNLGQTKVLAQSGAVGVNGTLTTSGNIVASLPAFTLAQVGAVGLSGAITFPTHTFGYLKALSGPTLSLNASVGVSTTFAYGPPIVLQVQTVAALQMSGVLSLSGDLQITAYTIQQSGVVAANGSLALQGDLSYFVPFPITLAQVGAVGLQGSFAAAGTVFTEVPFTLVVSNMLGVQATLQFPLTSLTFSDLVLVPVAPLFESLTPFPEIASALVEHTSSEALVEIAQPMQLIAQD